MMSNDLRERVARARAAYDDHQDITSLPEPDATTEYIAALETAIAEIGADQADTDAQAALEAVKREARNEARREAAKRIDAFLGCGRIGVDEYVKGQDECAVYLRSEILALMEGTDDDKR